MYLLVVDPCNQLFNSNLSIKALKAKATQELVEVSLCVKKLRNNNNITSSKALFLAVLFNSSDEREDRRGVKQ